MKQFFKGSMILGLASIGLSIVKMVIDSKQEEIEVERRFDELYDKRMGEMNDLED